MKFKINQTLVSGQFIVSVELHDFTDNDEEKATKFGFPIINIWNVDLEPIRKVNVRVNQLIHMKSSAFQEKEKAELYVKELKEQIKKIKKEWLELKDDWTSEEVL